MMLPDWIPALIAWLGVVVSFVFLRRAQKSNESANRTQEEMLQLQTRIAERQLEDRRLTRWDVWVEPIESQDQDAKVLIVRCLGPAEAIGVKILLDGVKASQHEVVLDPADPPSPMRPGAEANYKFKYVKEDQKIDVRIEWVDPAGRTQNFETILMANRAGGVPEWDTRSNRRPGR